MEDILEEYAAAATPGLIARYEAFDPADLYAPVLDLLPDQPAHVADIGAGTGRDAAWFARQGHTVVAVEPVRELRNAGMALHARDRIEWMDDTLPALAKLGPDRSFGLIVLNGVWHHVEERVRAAAIANLGRLTAAGGVLNLSLRHGPGPAGRRAFPIDPQDTITPAAGCGFRLLRRVARRSIQPGNRAMGVHWTWLAFRKGG